MEEYITHYNTQNGIICHCIFSDFSLLNEQALNDSGISALRQQTDSETQYIDITNGSVKNKSEFAVIITGNTVSNIPEGTYVCVKSPIEDMFKMDASEEVTFDFPVTGEYKIYLNRLHYKEKEIIINV